MYKFRVILLLTILCVLKVTEAVFVSVADIEEKYHKMGINLPQCGLSYTKRFIHRNKVDIDYDNSCFSKHHKSQIFYDFSIPGQRDKYPMSSNRIYKGQIVEEGEAPWAVFIGFTDREIIVEDKKPYLVYPQTYIPLISFCTGVLITFEWLLTSASCFDVMNKPDHKIVDIVVSAGSNKPYGIEGETVYINQNKVFQHPMFNSSTGNFDIALVKIQEKFTERKNNQRNYLINTICVPKYDPNPNFHKENVTAFGFGHMISNRDPQPIHKVDLQIPGPRIGHSGFEIPINNDSPATCAADAGGPLVQYLYEGVHRAVLVGINKNHEPCSDKIKSNYFQPVTRHNAWILHYIEQN